MHWSALTKLQPDPLLVRRVLDGDKAAFTILYDRHARKVFHLLRRLTTDATVAEDLAQESWLIAYDSLGRWRGQGQLSSFLCGIAVRVFQNHNRREIATENLDAVDEAYLAAPASQGEGWAHLSRHEADQALEAAIAALPLPVRTVYILVRVEGMRYRDVADTLGIPLGTVQSRLNRATHLLFTSLAPFLGDAFSDAITTPAQGEKGEHHVKYAR